MATRRQLIPIAIASLLALLLAAGCTNHVGPLPTPTVPSSARAPGATSVSTVEMEPTRALEPTPTPEARATPASAGDVSIATVATAEPAAVGGGSNDTFHFRGPADAAVTVAEFADFQ